MNKKRLTIALVIGLLLLTSTATFALQNYFNPNSIKTDTEADKKIIANQMTVLERANNGVEKNFKESDILVEQIYKLYYIDTQKIEGNKINDLDSLLIDNDLDYSIYLSKDASASMCVVYAKDEHGNKQSVFFSNDEGVRIKKLYNTFLKNKKIDDIKVIAHPSHEANKLFYITEKGEKYIVPAIVDGREEEVGLKSYKKYTTEEILKNISDYVINSKGKGID